MGYRLIFRLLSLVLLGTAGLAGAANAQAQGPARTAVFVYGATFYGGRVSGASLVPPQVDTIYLLANAKNILAPRYTLIYFWPLTNRYLADWEARNELVRGTLQVIQGSQVIQNLSLDDYVSQYLESDPEASLVLYAGEEARQRYAAFKALMAQYRRDSDDYLEAYKQFQRKTDEILQSRPPGGNVPPEAFPEEPKRPTPVQLHSSDPEQGFVISLPAGEYSVQLKRTDGTIQTDSYKHLVIFDRQRDGTAYSIVPQSRWNKPESSDDPGAVIYALSGTKLYLEPYRSGLYNAYYYDHMQEPQDVASRIDRNRWVILDSGISYAMTVTGGSTPLNVQRLSYAVRQLPGGALGYEVIPMAPDSSATSSFQGYGVDLSNPSSDFTVQLVDDKGAPISGSERRLMVMATERGPWLYSLAILPLLVGIVAWLARRRTVRMIQVDG
jgi:hypothetical protein